MLGTLKCTSPHGACGLVREITFKKLFMVVISATEKSTRCYEVLQLGDLMLRK